MRVVVLPILLLVVAGGMAPGAAAPGTAGCVLIPHGFLMGVDECAVSGFATESVYAQVSVTQGTVDLIEIEMLAPDGSTHVFPCSYAVTSSVCFFPVQVTGSVDGTWKVTARIVAADPLGPVLFGGADTYARLDVTFV